MGWLFKGLVSWFELLWSWKVCIQIALSSWVCELMIRNYRPLNSYFMENENILATSRKHKFIITSRISSDAVSRFPSTFIRMVVAKVQKFTQSISKHKTLSLYSAWFLYLFAGLSVYTMRTISITMPDYVT